MPICTLFVTFINLINLSVVHIELHKSCKELGMSSGIRSWYVTAADAGSSRSASHIETDFHSNEMFSEDSLNQLLSDDSQLWLANTPTAANTTTAAALIPQPDWPPMSAASFTGELQHSATGSARAHAEHPSTVGPASATVASFTGSDQQASAGEWLSKISELESKLVELHQHF